MKTPQEVLREAAAVIERDGWHQGAYYESSPDADHAADIEAAKSAPVCALGAISRAVYKSAWYSPNYVESELFHDERLTTLQCAATMLLKAQLGGAVSVPSWNDSPERTAEDVILAMKEASTR